MSDVKYTIGLLCKLINSLVHTHLKPEHFRLAKFDKTDNKVVEIFWTTLHALITPPNENFSTESVKQHLAALNYSSAQYFALPANMKHGSREVLLAFAWLFPKVLPKLIRNVIECSPFHPSYNLLHGSSDTSGEMPPQVSVEAHCENYLLWLRGRIEQNRKMAREINKQNRKILKKLSSLCTDGLITNEILALNSRKYCKQFLENSGRVLEVLECYNLWTKKEDTFWLWMGTVLMERGKSIKT